MYARASFGLLLCMSVAATVWACGGGGDGAAGPPTEPRATGTVTGQVTDLGGAGIAGITVRLRQEGATSDAKPAQTTNAQGRYTFSGVAAGTYRVSIEVPDTLSADSRPTEQAVSVEAGATATVSPFQLRLRAGMVAGLVTDNVLTPLPNRTVRLRKTTGGERSATTGSDGRYSFSNVTIGQYTLTVDLQCGESGGSGPGTFAVSDGMTTIADARVTTRGPELLLACEVQPIFTRSCGIAGCHSGTSPEEGLNLSTAALTKSTAINVPSNQRPAILRIKPFFADSASSYVMCKIVPVCALRAFSRMPLTGSPLTTAQIDTIRTWIAQGAKDIGP